MAAESLTRRAFPHHPQLWRVWSREAARDARGRWAAPSAAISSCRSSSRSSRCSTTRPTAGSAGGSRPKLLTDPNILSSRDSGADADRRSRCRRAFMEECLFRAVPLALGALIGARFGRRTLGIAIAFVLQAVVFGAAHANYPGLSVVFAAGRARPAVDRCGRRSSCASACCRRSCCTRCSISRCSRSRCSWSTRPAPACSAALVIAAGARAAARRAGAARAHGRVGRAARRASQRRVAARAARRPPRVRRASRSRASIGTPAMRCSARCRCSGIAGLVAWIAFTPLRADVAAARDRSRASRRRRPTRRSRSAASRSDPNGTAWRCRG